MRPHFVVPAAILAAVSVTATAASAGTIGAGRSPLNFEQTTHRYHHRDRCERSRRPARHEHHRVPTKASMVGLLGWSMTPDEKKPERVGIKGKRDIVPAYPRYGHQRR